MNKCSSVMTDNSPELALSVGQGSRKRSSFFSGPATKAFPPPLELSGYRNSVLLYTCVTLNRKSFDNYEVFSISIGRFI